MTSSKDIRAASKMRLSSVRVRKGKILGRVPLRHPSRLRSVYRVGMDVDIQELSITKEVR